MNGWRCKRWRGGGGKLHHVSIGLTCAWGPFHLITKVGLSSGTIRSAWTWHWFGSNKGAFRGLPSGDPVGVQDNAPMVQGDKPT